MFRRVGITRGMLRSLPPQQGQQTQISNLPIPQRRALLRVFTKCVRELASMLYPADSGALYAELFEKKFERTQVAKALVEGVQSARKGSVEKRVIRACLCASYPGIEVHRLLKEATEAKSQGRSSNGNQNNDNNNNSDDGGDDDDLDANGATHDDQGNNQGTNSNTLDNTNDCNNSDSNNVHTSNKPACDEGDHVNEPPKKKAKYSGAFKRTFRQAQQDWKNLIDTGSIPGLVNTTVKRAVIRGDNEMVLHALRFIFRSENVHLVSNGVFRLKHNGVYKDFPILYRRLYQDVEQLWKNYKMEIEANGSTTRHFSRTIILAFVKEFTRGQTRRRGATDYVPEFLIYKNFRLVERIIEQVKDKEVSKFLLDKLHAVEDFVRFTYATHIDDVENPKDPFHDSEFALASQEMCDSTRQQPRMSQSVECLRPFQVLTEIQKNIPELREDIVHALSDAKEKIINYMGHKHRGAAQDKHVCRMFEKLKQHSIETAAVVMINFNMRFEGVRIKNGINCHGAAVFFRPRNKNLVTVGSYHLFNSFISKDSASNPELSSMFIDHVPDSNIEPDVAVLQIVDALFARIRFELPNLAQIWVVSDDARCYQNELFPVFLPFLAHRHGLQLNGLIHSETEVGRCVADAHFNIALKHVEKYCQEKKIEITNATDLTDALSHSGGLCNSTVETVKVEANGRNLQPWLQGKKLRKMVKLFRVNEFEYGTFNGDRVCVTCIKLSDGNGRLFEFGRHYSKELTENPEGDIMNTTGANQYEPEVNVDNMGMMDEENRHLFSRESNLDMINHNPHSVSPSFNQNSSINAISQFIPESGATGNTNPTPTPVPNRNTDEIMFQGAETDVVVSKRTPVNKRATYRRIMTDSVLDDTVSEIERQAEAYDEGDDMDDNEPVEQDRTGKDMEPGGSQDIRQQQRQSRAVVKRATSIALAMLENRELVVLDRRVQNPILSQVEIDRATYIANSLQPGWARRSQSGLTHGRNFVSVYAADITTMHNEYFKTKGKGLSAKLIKDALHEKYPDRYDIPSEYHINVFIAPIRKSLSSSNATNAATVNVANTAQNENSTTLVSAPPPSNNLPPVSESTGPPVLSVSTAQALVPPVSTGLSNSAAHSGARDENLPSAPDTVSSVLGASSTAPPLIPPISTALNMPTGLETSSGLAIGLQVATNNAGSTAPDLVTSAGLTTNNPTPHAGLETNTQAGGVAPILSRDLPNGSDWAEGLNIRYAQGIREMVVNDKSVVPNNGRARLIEILNLDAQLLPPDFPDEHTIQRNVSSLQSILNQQDE